MMVKYLALALALCAPAAARAEWHEASSRHFVVYSDDREEAVRAFAEKLERFDKALREFEGIEDEDLGPANRVTVYVVANDAEVRKLGRFDPSSLVAGFYRGNAGRAVAVTPRRSGSGDINELNPAIVLLHEYAHHFMLQNFAAAYPTWYQEGFAEFGSTARFEKDGSVGFGAPANHRAWGLFRVKPLPIELLFDPTRSKLNAEEWEATVYGRGWLLTHYLTFNKARAGQLGTYLRAINSGTGSVEAARAAFGDLAVLDKELKLYVEQKSFSYLPIPAAKLTPGPVAMRTLRAGEEAIMALRMRSRLGVIEKDREQVALKMRAAAAPFASDPAVQVALAEAEFDAGHLDEADAAADRALAADPKLVDAFLYKARVRMERAKAAPASFDAAAWKETRRLIGAANRADPNNPEPLIMFFSAFGAQGVPANANAVEGLIQAFAFAPQDQGLRLTTAFQYLVDGHAREARAALAPIAFDPHGGETAKGVARVLALLDKGGAKAALDGWTEAMKPEPKDQGAKS